MGSRPSSLIKRNKHRKNRSSGGMACTKPSSHSALNESASTCDIEMQELSRFVPKEREDSYFLSYFEDDEDEDVVRVAVNHNFTSLD